MQCDDRLSYSTARLELLLLLYLRAILHRFYISTPIYPFAFKLNKKKTCLFCVPIFSVSERTRATGLTPEYGARFNRSNSKHIL